MADGGSNPKCVFTEGVGRFYFYFGKTGKWEAPLEDQSHSQ